MKVSIVIPNYNGFELLVKNLPSIIDAYKNPKNNIVEVIIVDDASIDESPFYIKSNWPDIKLIRHTVNRGFSASCNTGARSSHGELLCLLNTDVVPSRDFLENIAKHFKDDKVFAVSLHEEGYGWARGYFKDGFVEHSPGGESSVRESFWASGGSAVFRKRYWTRLGGFDEKLLSPFYWEDIDLCYRAQKRGYKVLWDMNSKVTHKHESTVSKLRKGYVNRIRERNQLIFIWKNVTSPRLTRKHIRGLIRRFLRHPRYIFVVLSAFRKIKPVLKSRRKEKKEAKVSDEAIFARFK